VAAFTSSARASKGKRIGHPLHSANLLGRLSLEDALPERVPEALDSGNAPCGDRRGGQRRRCDRKGGVREFAMG